MPITLTGVTDNPEKGNILKVSDFMSNDPKQRERCESFCANSFAFVVGKVYIDSFEVLNSLFVGVDLVV